VTSYEIIRCLFEPALPVLYSKARSDLRQLVKETLSHPVSILDVGGRTSPYTISLSAHITLLDMPRQKEKQKQLHLGVTDEMIRALRCCRSNIKKIIIEDMTRSTLSSHSFDGVASVEVIEHVPDDKSFIRQIARVLKPGGWLYLTTPNGDYIKNEPQNETSDHVRHYTRSELSELLSEYFADVSVVYGVKTGKFRYKGLRSFHKSNPLKIAESMICNLINRIESRGLEQQPLRTAHLFAISRKKKNI
jgi:SAM-dependent methyltransferase